MLNKGLRRSKDKQTADYRDNPSLNKSSTRRHHPYNYASAATSLTGPNFLTSADNKYSRSHTYYETDSEDNYSKSSASESSHPGGHRTQLGNSRELEDTVPDTRLLRSLLDGAKQHHSSSSNRKNFVDFINIARHSPQEQLNYSHINFPFVDENSDEINIRGGRLKSSPTIQGCEEDSVYSFTDSSITQDMGHTSSKRSRHESTQHEIATLGSSRSSHGQNRYADGVQIRDDFARSSNPIPGKNYRRSFAAPPGKSPPEQASSGIDLDEEDQRRTSGTTSWSQKKLGGSQPQIEARSSKDAASVPRSFNSQPRFLHASAIKLHKLQFGIDKRLTIIDEKSNAVLKYRTPHFRALATVEIPPLPAGVNIQVGWIQVCTDMQFINTYGNEGLTSWEFPEIVSGKYKMVSDADGKQYPWYGSKNEVAHLQGPTQNPTTATIHMNDNFFPQVTWYIPSIGYTRDPSLTFVYRKQRFYTFLALKDVNTDTYQIIRTLTWSMELAIDVNPKNPLGKRAKLLGPFEQESPRVVPEHLTPPLKSYALNPPNANSCQVLVWRPKYGDTELVVPPVQTTMDMSRYLISTRDATAKLLRITKSSFLLRSQQQHQQQQLQPVK